MQFLKNHWFGFIISIIVAVFMLEFILVLIAPQQDEQNRGFVPCTQKMAAEVYDCNKSSFCVLSAVIDNSFCNLGVIGKGLKLWVSGKQSAPWSNFLFEPTVADEKEAEISQEELQEFYQKNPNISGEMKELKKLNDKLEIQDEQ